MTSKTIARRYVLTDKIGSGGMGTVYKGLDSQTEQTIAVKELHSNLTDDQLIERFKREGEALRELNHPNIVKMLDAVEEDQKHYLIMEFVAGKDVANLLKQGQLPIERILNILIDLADALTRAHRLNIIHRDLKPANILIGDDGTLRLTDFGVAHVGSKERVTDTDTIVGTIDYLPPEAFDGVKFDERGDIWAFGVILFEMLTGKRPFGGETIVQFLHSITTDPVPDIDELRADIPVALVDLTYRMLERNVDARIRSVRQIGLELEDILHGRTTQTVPQIYFDVNESDIFAVKKHNLPVQTTPFVGRESELNELSKLITEPTVRLITIIAPGGMGKTRLALEAAEGYLDHFDDGVYIVELAPLFRTEQIIPSIGSALDYKFQQGEGFAKQELFEFLSNKQMLLIMDNFEHLLDGAELVGELLSQTNHLKIVVTSRQRLAQTGENVLHLGGMDFPAWETPTDALNSDAVKLFINSAKRAKPGFELTVDNLDYVAQICKLVQGMPLGIVLSAAWIEMLSPKEIATELEQSMEILSDEVGELPARQQSIRVVMEYAWGMMNIDEQAVFMKLSVFRGGFTREAAQEVANATLRTLMSLVTKSLIRRDTDSGRYEIHELLRQYAFEKLSESGDTNTAYEHHARFFSAFLAEQLPLLKGGGQLKALSAIDIDYENCYSAWRWSVENSKPELIDKMIDCLYLYFQFNYMFDAGYRLFEMARQRWQVTANAANLLAARLSIRFIGTEDKEIVQPLVEQALELAQEHDNIAEIAFCRRELGRLFGHHLWDQVLIYKGIENLEISLQLYHQLDEAYFEALILDDIGYAYHRFGEFEKRIDYSGRSLELREQIGDWMGYGDCLNGYATSIFPTGLERPIELLEQGRDLAYVNKSSYMLNMILPFIGLVYVFKGEYDKALETFKTAHQLSLASHNERWRVSSIFGLVYILSILNQDMDLASEYLQEVPPDSSLIYKESQVISSRLFALAYYGARTGDEKMMYTYIHMMMNGWMRLIGLVLQAVTFVPLAALWLGKNGNPKRAVHWLAFAQQWENTHNIHIYSNHWDVIVDYRESLRTRFGDEHFDALWEEGKTLDEDTVKHQLLAEFGEEQ